MKNIEYYTDIFSDEKERKREIYTRLNVINNIIKDAKVSSETKATAEKLFFWLREKREKKEGDA